MQVTLCMRGTTGMHSREGPSSLPWYPPSSSLPSPVCVAESGAQGGLPSSSPSRHLHTFSTGPHLKPQLPRHRGRSATVSTRLSWERTGSVLSPAGRSRLPGFPPLWPRQSAGWRSQGRVTGEAVALSSPDPRPGCLGQSPGKQDKIYRL